MTINVYGQEKTNPSPTSSSAIAQMVDKSALFRLLPMTQKPIFIVIYNYRSSRPSAGLEKNQAGCTEQAMASLSAVSRLLAST